MKSIQAIPLGAVVEIKTGFTLRKRPSEPSHGEVRLLGASDVQPPGRIVDDAPLYVKLENSLEKYAIEPGDVLFKSRGSRFDAACVERLAMPTFYAGPLLKLAYSKATFDGRYLAWFLNSAHTQRQLEAVARGSTIPTVGANALRKIEIDVPPLEVQREIVALDQLRLKETELMTRLMERRKQHLDSVLAQAARKSPGPVGAGPGRRRSDARTPELVSMTTPHIAKGKE